MDRSIDRSSNHVRGMEKERREEALFPAGALSCIRKLVDVSQVGVVENESDSLQRVGLSYSLQLHLATKTECREIAWECPTAEAAVMAFAEFFKKCFPQCYL